MAMVEKRRSLFIATFIKGCVQFYWRYLVATAENLTGMSMAPREEVVLLCQGETYVQSTAVIIRAPIYR